MYKYQALPKGTLEALGKLIIAFGALDETATFCAVRMLLFDGTDIPAEEVARMGFTEKLDRIKEMAKVHAKRHCLLEELTYTNLRQLQGEARNIANHRNDLVHGVIRRGDGGELEFQRLGKTPNRKADPDEISNLSDCAWNCAVRLSAAAIRFTKKVQDHEVVAQVDCLKETDEDTPA